MEVAQTGPIRIRRALLEDTQRARDAHIASVLGLCAADYTPEQLTAWTSREAQDYARRIANHACAFLIAEAGEVMAGFAAFLSGELLSLYVRPEHARRGVGAALLAAAEAAARQQDYRSIYLNSSLTAVEFYRRHGYEELGPGSFRMENGVVIPCVRMRKRL